MPPPVLSAPHQLYRFAFTWNKPGDISDDEFKAKRELLEEALAAVNADDYIYQLERGEEKDRLHYQGYLKLKTKKYMLTIAKDMQTYCDGIHLSACSAAGETALRNYCMKDETKVTGPWSLKPMPTRPFMLINQYDPLKKCRRVTETPRPFQTSLTEMCMAEPDDRKIVWVADADGNSGKSQWATFMRIKHSAYEISFGTARDLMHMVCQDIEERGGFRQTYIISLPRTKPKDQAMADILSTIEQIKDGKFKSTKYKGNNYEGPNPHVVILSNYAPTTEEIGGLTKDRWMIYKIEQSDWSLRRIRNDERVCSCVRDFCICDQL